MDGYSFRMDVPFDHELYISDFQNCIKKKTFHRLRQLRILVQNQTIEALKNNRYVYGGVNGDSKIVKIFSTEEEKSRMIEETQICKEKEITEFPNQEFLKNGVCSVEVWNMDCLLAAIKLKNEGCNPCVLNMANRSTPGGGFRMGCGAQEENLMRRTTLFTSFYGEGDFKKTWEYPLPKYGGCYNSKCKIFRDSEANGYGMLPNPIEMSFVSVAALVRPRLYRLKKDRFKEYDKHFGDSMYNRDDEISMLRKVEAILKIAKKKGHDSCVLSALGCGAFRNPPFHCAVIFKKALEKFKYDFRRIVFAIIEDHNSKNNEFGNLKPFQYVFRTSEIRNCEENEKE